MTDAAIFDIQRFAVHDGPGIRTTVFFKGCSNRCNWCHNPESFKEDTQLQFYPQRCTFCMQCLKVCPSGAHMAVDNRHEIDRDTCTLCGACADACYAGALVMTGRRWTLDEVMRPVLDDMPYYETSGGGVTLSGGEPPLQSAFAGELLRALKERGIHTNLQTAGNYPFALLEGLLPHLDMVMYDIKGISEDIYTHHIHGERARMLDNLLRLDAAFDGPIIVRTPVIGGVNATADEIEAIARFLRPLKRLQSYRLMPYHGLGKAKYEALGIGYDYPYTTPAPDCMAALERAAARHVPVFNIKNGFIKEE